MTSNSEHLKWIHDRMVNVYGVSTNVDFLIRFRKIIKEIEATSKVAPTRGQQTENELDKHINDDYYGWDWDIN